MPPVRPTKKEKMAAGPRLSRFAPGHERNQRGQVSRPSNVFDDATSDAIATDASSADRSGAPNDVDIGPEISEKLPSDLYIFAEALARRPPHAPSDLRMAVDQPRVSRALPPRAPCLSCARKYVKGFEVECSRRSAVHSCGACARAKHLCAEVSSGSFACFVADLEKVPLPFSRIAKVLKWQADTSASLGVDFNGVEASAFRERAQSFCRRVTAWQKKRSDVTKKVSGEVVTPDYAKLNYEESKETNRLLRKLIYVLQNPGVSLVSHCL